MPAGMKASIWEVSDTRNEFEFGLDLILDGLQRA